MSKIKVTIWNEFVHEQEGGALGVLCRQWYPQGIHKYLAGVLAADDLEIRAVSLDMPEQGLPDALIEDTDVLMWWGHVAHSKVDDALVEKLAARVCNGMGFIPMHSAHLSKLFRRLMGTSCTLHWREVGEKERIWTVPRKHPIAAGVPETFTIPHTEMYGEAFDIPDDGKIIFTSWYEGGNVFRSGVTFQRGNGKIFYFSPGHETFPIYHNENVQKVLANAIRWAAPDFRDDSFVSHTPQPLETVYSENPLEKIDTSALHKTL